MSAREEVRALVYGAALKVECPLCRQKVGAGCATRRGERLREPHARRVDMAREAGHWSVGT